MENDEVARLEAARGSFEVEVSQGEAGDLSSRVCRKNPGHVDFFPVKDFNIENLPPDYQDRKIVDVTKAIAELTVRVLTKHKSKERPKVWPQNGASYPFHNCESSNISTKATGWIQEVEIYSSECDCAECKGSDSAHMRWGLVHVHTGAHVVFNLEEARHTTLECFYDSDIDRCQSVSTLSHATDGTFNVEADRCEMIFHTHDIVLLERLKVACDKRQEIQREVRDIYCTTGSFCSVLSTVIFLTSLNMITTLTLFVMLDWIDETALFSFAFVVFTFVLLPAFWMVGYLPDTNPALRHKSISAIWILLRQIWINLLYRRFDVVGKFYVGLLILQWYMIGSKPSENPHITLILVGLTMLYFMIPILRRRWLIDFLDAIKNPAIGIKWNITSFLPYIILSMTSIFNIFNNFTTPAHRLTIIVSHPHGCSKMVSVGLWEHRQAHDRGITQNRYTYNTSTCRGSSGAPVYVLGDLTKSVIVHDNHAHSGYAEDHGLNMSGGGFDSF